MSELRFTGKPIVKASLSSAAGRRRRRCYNAAERPARVSEVPSQRPPVPLLDLVLLGGLVAKQERTLRRAACHQAIAPRPFASTGIAQPSTQEPAYVSPGTGPQAGRPGHEPEHGVRWPPPWPPQGTDLPPHHCSRAHICEAWRFRVPRRYCQPAAPIVSPTSTTRQAARGI